MRFIRLNDYTWWLWLGIASCLLVGLVATPLGIGTAVFLSTAQAMIFTVKERGIASFPAQLRIAYLLIVLVGAIPPFRIFLWIPTLGTCALCLFGYCLLARGLSLMPWNRTTPLTVKEAVETFLVAPDPTATGKAREASGCPGGVCTLDVQLARLRKNA